ncbi:MAG: serine/threonine-protein kinase [Acidimicrobiales bacterium]
MSRSLWTGPRSDPRRYRVTLDGDEPVPEPGSGGDGLVFAARTRYGSPDGTERQVALKLKLRVRELDEHELARRASILKAVDHPNVMRATDGFIGPALTAEDPDSIDDDAFDLVWVVLEWVEGQRLSTMLPVDPDTALTMTAQIARGVASMHAMRSEHAPSGVLHRDVKPSNVKLTPEGTAVLIDFGSAGPAHDAWVQDGTPGWLAPEVVAGAPMAAPSDVWGVGAVAHAAITGRVPLHDGAACSRERIRVVLDAAGHPASVAVADHIAALLETDPAARPSDLDRWADGLDALRKGVPRSDRSRARTVVIVGVVAVAVAAIGWALLHSATGRDAAATGRRDGSPTTTRSTPGAGVEVAAESTEVTAPTSTERFGEAVVRRIVPADGDSADVELVSPDGVTVRLTDVEYRSYREIAGRAQPEAATRYGGYPTGIRRQRDPAAIVIELSKGGLIVGQRDDTQMFWIPLQARGQWEADGGLTGKLGFPVSNPYFTGTGLQLDFERGSLTVGLEPGAPVNIAATYLVDPAATLTPLGDLRGHVLRQAGSTTWFVDDHLVRHWIRDADVYRCLDAASRQIPGDAPGAGVFSLRLGAPATCALARVEAR